MPFFMSKTKYELRMFLVAFLIINNLYFIDLGLPLFIVKVKKFNLGRINPLP